LAPTKKTKNNKKKQMNSFIIRNASRAELDLLMDWANLEGWNTGKYDAEAFFTTDPNGYFIGLLDEIPIGSVSGVRLSDNYGFIGFYIMKPEYRGKGYGIQLFKKAIEYLGDRNVALDAVPEQQENYAKVNLLFFTIMFVTPGKVASQKMKTKIIRPFQ
jgi:GNAT superfamily N-acetyltransferase